MVDAVAGSGKTTTNVIALELLPKSTNAIYAAFNKHIEQDIRSKSPEHVQVSTFHRWGLNNIRKAYPNVDIEPAKLRDLLNSFKLYDMSSDLKNSVIRLVGLLKATLLEPTQDNIMDLADIHNIDIELQETGLVTRLFKESIKDTSRIDFDDMVYYPASGIVECGEWEYIFVDEFQDLNTAQFQLAIRSLGHSSRLMGIGDPFQAIYAFRGAFVGIMDHMRDKLDAVSFPLSISYRAPLSIVELVNQKFPHINFEASPTAKDGSISVIKYDQFYDVVKPSHGVICRTNAPLVEPCFNLIRDGIKASILGRDIGTSLVRLIEKREKLVRVTSLDDLLGDLRIFRENETRKFSATKKPGRAALLKDQVETIYALASGCQSIGELKRKTKSVFSNQRQGVIFSSIHKAKGLEWDTVHILEPGLMPHPMAESEVDLQQEQNIEYVAVTRSKNKLFYVIGD